MSLIMHINLLRILIGQLSMEFWTCHNLWQRHASISTLAGHIHTSNLQPLVESLNSQDRILHED
jgi:hypothetical protein